MSRGDANLWRETIEVGGHLFVPIGETGDSRIDVSVGEVIEFQVSGVVVERRAGKQSLGWANARALKKTTEPPTPLSDVLRYGDANDPSAALTVLPRLTALADMSLPIVLFSSTGRRDIVAKLDGYESVVTRFSKPRFFGDASNVAEETDRAFAEALTEAAVLLRGRRSISSATGVPTTTHVRRTVGTGYRHASLYLDESGDAGQVPFTVGGILALFPDSSMEQTFDKKLKDCKIHWGPGGLGKYKDTSPESLEVYGTKIINEASDSGVALRAIALTVLDPEGAVATRIGRTSTTARSLDRLHRTLFRTAIEIALFHVIVDEEIDKNWTFGVCTDVRNRPARLFAEAQLRELRDQFGLYPEVFAPNQRGWKAAGTLLTLFSGSREDRLSLYTVLADFLKRGFPLPAAPNSQLIRFHEAVDGLLEGTATAKAVSDLLDELLRKESRIGFIGSDEVLPLVEDLLNGYEGAERLQHVRITEARACHLPEGNKSALSATNRSLNFFADWLAGAVRDSHKNAGIALPQWAMDLLDDGGCNDIYDTG
ncbi:MAG: hypothetical protein Q8R92_04525, partial [Deltaproteobacteria bacterium]|nr:hypothetical protein [Deltaproteobacteria bacterium]